MRKNFVNMWRLCDIIMGMKPTMLFAIVMLTAIVMIAGFGLQLDRTPAIELSAANAANALFVCPAASMWDTVALSMRMMHRYMTMGFFLAAVLLLSVWGWNLYQNLLKDKFERGAFTKVWKLTKYLFWAAVILLLMAKTPNYFRRVRVDGDNRAWVLCESNSPGARAVRAGAVHSH